ncbi:hypothetical protein ACR6C2_05520 [Streptomyces sp. INA 01156]
MALAVGVFADGGPQRGEQCGAGRLGDRLPAGLPNSRRPAREAMERSMTYQKSADSPGSNSPSPAVPRRC